MGETATSRRPSNQELHYRVLALEAKLANLERERHGLATDSQRAEILLLAAEVGVQITLPPRLQAAEAEDLERTLRWFKGQRDYRQACLG